MLRIGMLTSGGDCQALNAAMRGVVKGLFQARKDVEIYGFEEGYKGLIYSNFRMLKAEDFSGILQSRSYEAHLSQVKSGLSCDPWWKWNS